MTRDELDRICDFLNDEHERGGQSVLARKLGWAHSTAWRKLNGKSEIIKADELLILDAVPERRGR